MIAVSCILVDFPNTKRSSPVAEAAM